MATTETETETETVTIGGVSVPKQFSERWNELLAANKKLKSSLQESQANLVLAQEEAASGATAELAKAQTRIAELEGAAEQAGWSSALQADGLDGDADVLDYLQYQYGKVTPAEGETKPSVKDWYQGVREKNPVVQAAAKAAQAATATDKKGETSTTTPKKEKEPATPGKIQVSTRPVVPKTIPADTAAISAENLVKMDVRDFAANKDNLRKQLFGGS